MDIYEVTTDYVEFLRKFEPDKILRNRDDKFGRKFVGIIVQNDKYKYVVPLSSPKYLKDYKMTMDTEASYLSIPLEVGYKITTENGKWGIAPFAGLGFNIGLKGKQKINEHLDGREEYKLKIGGKIGVEGRIGLRILLANFQIIGSYHLPLNKKQEQFFGEDAYPELSIGFGF